jgi:hypothetical protein
MPPTGPTALSACLHAGAWDNAAPASAAEDIFRNVLFFIVLSSLSRCQEDFGAKVANSGGTPKIRFVRRQKSKIRNQRPYPES